MTVSNGWLTIAIFMVSFEGPVPRSHQLGGLATNVPWNGVARQARGAYQLQLSRTHIKHSLTVGRLAEDYYPVKTLEECRKRRGQTQ